MKDKRMQPKDVKALPGKHIAICYCGAQFLLARENRIGYVANSNYGWCYDVYCIDGKVISTGYRNMLGEHLKYDELQKWEDKAQKLSENYASTEERLALMHEWVATL